MSGRLFVVVSTGQNVANLPPLLEHAEPGDKVVWVESAPARRGRWSAGARGVLERLGLVTLPDTCVEEIDDLAGLADASRDAVEHARREGLRAHLILNGGPKLTPLGLLRAWGGLEPVLLYGEQQPAVCKSFHTSLAGPAEVRPYHRHMLDLPEVLEVSGHQLHDSRGTKFWPGPLADDLARERYGDDAAFTAGLHQAHHLRGQPLPREALPSYRVACQLTEEEVRKWKQDVLSPLRKRGLQMSADDAGPFELLYNRTLGLAWAAAKERHGAARPAVEPLGPAFHRAVARRVHAWLEAVNHPAVHSAWRDVKVAGRRDPHVVLAEFDVLLVLKNGVLWHLECKSFEADLKDLDARLFNLQQAGSQLARMALCGPVLTGCAGEPWFTAQHDLRLRIEARQRLTFVPFTLPGQPGTYVVEEVGAPQTFACPTLEETLEGALRIYRPVS
jgi:hypothetical protein